MKKGWCGSRGKDGFLVNQLDKLNTHMGKDEFWPNLRPYTKIHSRLIADLNVKHQIIKLLEENISKHSGDQEIFFKQVKSLNNGKKINNLDYIKNFCSLKEMISRSQKGKPERENTCTSSLLPIDLHLSFFAKGKNLLYV